MSGPIPVMVRRFECPWCKRRRASKAVMVGHVAVCWLDPANRACKTCQHRIEPYSELEVGINDPEGCEVRADVEPDQFPVSHCPMWELRDALT